jgi:hypothetical protein
MTDLSRGARVRRGGRRQGWLLLTALLVLAIAASSALVLTNRVALLKLAVILALWAAVVAAFVSVIYRRQSDVDQARARDLKLVYDLQLDREISARREYELTVESQLRRELASELRAHAADEVAALRAELAALRTNLEILFNTELDERPALETERKIVRRYSHWDRENESTRGRVSRVTSVRAEEPARRVDDSSIIDVPEEPLTPPPRQPMADGYPASYAYQAAQGDRGARAHPEQPSQAGGRAPSGVSQANGGEPPFESPPARRSRLQDEAPPQHPEPRFAPPNAPPQPQPDHGPPPTYGGPPPGRSAPNEARRPRDSVSNWQPVGSQGHWPPAGTRGSNWNSDPGNNDGAGAGPYDSAPSPDNGPFSSPSFGGPTSAATQSDERRGWDSSVTEQAASRVGEPGTDWREAGRRARARHSTEEGARHSAEYADSSVGGPGTPGPAMSPLPVPPGEAPVMSPPAPPAARHRNTDLPSDADSHQSGGQSVADLLARLQTGPSTGGRRRRRED